MLTARQFGRYPWSVVDELLSMQDEFNDVLEGRHRVPPPVMYGIPRRDWWWMRLFRASIRRMQEENQRYKS